jgi:hypothetical protein
LHWQAFPRRTCSLTHGAKRDRDGFSHTQPMPKHLGQSLSITGYRGCVVARIGPRSATPVQPDDRTPHPCLQVFQLAPKVHMLGGLPGLWWDFAFGFLRKVSAAPPGGRLARTLDGAAPGRPFSTVTARQCNSDLRQLFPQERINLLKLEPVVSGVAYHDPSRAH